jgi:hypothetical protein
MVRNDRVTVCGPKAHTDERHRNDRYQDPDGASLAGGLVRAEGKQHHRSQQKPSADQEKRVTELAHIALAHVHDQTCRLKRTCDDPERNSELSEHDTLPYLWSRCDECEEATPSNPAPPPRIGPFLGTFSCHGGIRIGRV